MCAKLWQRENKTQPLALDEEQARLLALLERAGGPVSFAQLREWGIENPATICYELEMAGVALRRHEKSAPGGGTVVVGVELAPELAQAVGQTPSSEGPPEPATDKVEPRAPRSAGPLAGTPSSWKRLRGVLQRALAPQPSRRSVAGIAFGGLVGLTVGLAVGLSGGSGTHHGLAASRTAAHSTTTTTTAHPPTTVTATHRTTAATTTTSARKETTSQSSSSKETPSAAQLEEEGHRLLEAGAYAAAAAKLEEAVRASGGSPTRCAQPETESCLTYAYALYDLGRALQGEHQSAAAQKVLSERLQIDNQRETVARALEQAKAQAPPPPPPPARHTQKTEPPPRHSQEGARGGTSPQGGRRHPGGPRQRPTRSD